jgi:hypothetical protein
MKKIRLSALLLVSALAAALVWCHRLSPPEIPDEQWTMTQMAQEMEKIGYQCEFVNNDRYPRAHVQGLFLARQDDARTWDEIVSGRARLQPNLKWNGLVSITRDFGSMVGEGRPEQLSIGPFCLYGDPEEIARIVAHFRGQRL